MYVIFTWSLFKLSFKYPLFKRNLIVHLSVKDRLRSSKVKFSDKNEKEVQVETDQSNFKQPCDWFLEISRWFLTGNALGTRMEKKPNGNLMYRLRRTCHWNWSFHAGGSLRLIHDRLLLANHLAFWMGHLQLQREGMHDKLEPFDQVVT